EPLGEEAYDAYTTSMSLGGYVAASAGRYELAQDWNDRVLKVYEDHGDIFGICTTLINRSTLWFLTGRLDLFVSELERGVSLCREYGMAMLEVLCVRNLGEIHLLMGKPAESEPYIQRARAMYAKSIGEGAALAVFIELQLARAKWWSGEIAAAQEIYDKVRTQQAAAEAAGASDAILTGSERLLLDQVGVALGSGSAAEFDALIARGHTMSLQPQDIVELIEWKGLAALRAGRRAEAIPLFEEAMAMAQQKAPLVTERVRAQLTAALGGGPAPASMQG
ncbi:MAG TPA: tetratricopeptide repeat protein, partial [Polyangia bacterium]|nr:tetratricopeptide repeat protein [Polyangia bacterium]